MSQSPSDGWREERGAPNFRRSALHRLLGAEHRRVALDVLNDRATPVELEDLAAAIASREPDTDAADGEVIEHLAIALHHKHLPLMAEFGILDYDSEKTVVESVDSNTVRWVIHAKKSPE